MYSLTHLSSIVLFGTFIIVSISHLCTSCFILALTILFSTEIIQATHGAELETFSLMIAFLTVTKLELVITEPKMFHWNGISL